MKKIVILSIIFTFLFSGCTTRIHYRHEWTDPNNVPQKVDVVYSAGVGNSEKDAGEIILADGSSLTFGKSTMNQDEFMKVLKQYGITLETIAEAWMKTIPLP